MKFVQFLALLLITSAGFAQVVVQQKFRTVIVAPTQYRDGRFDTLHIPYADTIASKDNPAAQIVIRPQDSLLYYHNGQKWTKVTGTSAGGVIAELDPASLHIVDTSATFSNFFRTQIARKEISDSIRINKIDTTGQFLTDIIGLSGDTLLVKKGRGYFYIVLQNGGVKTLYTNNATGIIGGTISGNSGTIAADTTILATRKYAQLFGGAGGSIADTGIIDIVGLSGDTLLVKKRTGYFYILIQNGGIKTLYTNSATGLIGGTVTGNSGTLAIDTNFISTRAYARGFGGGGAGSATPSVIAFNNRTYSVLPEAGDYINFYAAKNHGHVISDISGLSNALNAKQDSITVTTNGNTGPASWNGRNLNIPLITSTGISQETADALYQKQNKIDAYGIPFNLSPGNFRSALMNYEYMPGMAAYSTGLLLNNYGGSPSIARSGIEYSNPATTAIQIRDSGVLAKIRYDGLYKPFNYAPTWASITGKPSFGLPDILANNSSAPGSNAQLLNIFLRGNIGFNNTAGNTYSILQPVYNSNRSISLPLPPVAASYFGVSVDGNQANAAGNMISTPSWSNVLNRPVFSTVATTGNFNDLINKPPALGFTPVQQNGGAGQLGNKIYLGWDGNQLKAQIDNIDKGGIAFKSDISTAGKTGSFNDLLDKPPPAAGLGFTPVQQGGGTGQGTNKIYVGWNTTRLTGQVDNRYLGEFAFLSDLTWANILSKPSFSTVATSGNFNDLINKPVAPVLSTVATTGNFNDLINKPTQLAFTPIQQGGGAGQGNNKVYVGWNELLGHLTATIDATNLGSLALVSDIPAALPDASVSLRGAVNTTTQTFAGVKSFNNYLKINAGISNTGTAPQAGSAIDFSNGGANGGMAIPKLTAAQMSSIVPTNGTLAYRTDGDVGTYEFGRNYAIDDGIPAWHKLATNEDVRQAINATPIVKYKYEKGQNITISSNDLFQDVTFYSTVSGTIYLPSPGLSADGNTIRLTVLGANTNFNQSVYTNTGSTSTINGYSNVTLVFSSTENKWRMF